MGMNNTAKMAEILAVLRKQTNGAVTGSMEDRGVVWPLNYGVSVPAIRSLAGNYAPDHALGKLLYQQQVRELRLSGIMVADPRAVTADELPFWAAGVVNTEVAEHLSFLFAAGNIIPEIIEQWLSADNEWLQYAVLLSVTRRLASDGSLSGAAAWAADSGTGPAPSTNLTNHAASAPASDLNPFAIGVDKILTAYHSFLSVDCRPLWRAFAAFLSALHRVSPEYRPAVERLAKEFSDSDSGSAAAYVSEELYL